MILSAICSSECIKATGPVVVVHSVLYSNAVVNFFISCCVNGLTIQEGLGGIVGLGPPVLAARVRILAKPSCPVGDVALSR